MKASFKAISLDVLRLQQSAFVEYESGIQEKMQKKEEAIATLLKPLKESLEKVDTKMQELEKSRTAAYSAVHEQLKSLSSSQGKLEKETANLVKALRAPHVRGQWGELQLKRVVEMAGMVEHCDFMTQVTEEGEKGKIRPDMIVKLPNARTVIVDAKAPLEAYLDAIQATDEVVRGEKLKDHARQLKRHIMQLGEKNYFHEFARAADFVVLFLPSEAIFSAALEQDTALIEYGVMKKVIMATPTTLIALLRAVAAGWREEMVAEHAARISELGNELYDRLFTMGDHFEKLKRSLDSSCEAYNKVAGCFEGRVLVSARRFQELGVAKDKKPLQSVDPVEKLTRMLSPESATALQSEA